MYTDQYRRYYTELLTERNIASADGGLIVLGYTSDLDVFIQWDEQKFNEILAASEQADPILPNKDSVDTVDELFRVIAAYAVKGLGGEFRIDEPTVVRFLMENFQYTFGIGGTAAQAAGALGELSVPAMISMLDRSAPVVQRLDKPSLKTVVKDELVPIGQAVSDEEPVLHIIFQYPKGASLYLNGERKIIPNSNRMILHNDQVHRILPLDLSFLQWCEKNAGRMACYSVSGLNAIVDLGIANQRLDTLVDHFRIIKKENPECLIYFEGACYLNSAVKKAVFSRLSEVVDIYGINEEELVDLACDFGIPSDSQDAESIYSRLCILTEQYRIKGIVLHTKDFSMYYGKKFQGVDFEKGLTLGNMLSGTRALLGKYGNYEEIARILTYPLSVRGVEFAEKMAEMETEQLIQVVPSRYLDHPEFTIGLGDTFMAGMLLAFVPEKKKNH